MLKKEREEIVLALTYSLTKNGIKPKKIIEIFEDIHKYNPRLKLSLKTKLPTKRRKTQERPS